MTLEKKGFHFETAEFEAHFREQGGLVMVIYLCGSAVANHFSLFFLAGWYVAVLEYGHLSVKLDLQKAIGELFVLKVLIWEGNWHLGNI